MVKSSKETVHRCHKCLGMAIIGFVGATILLFILVSGSIGIPLAEGVISYVALSILLLGIGLTGIRLGSVSWRTHLKTLGG